MNSTATLELGIWRLARFIRHADAGDDVCFAQGFTSTSLRRAGKASCLQAISVRDPAPRLSSKSHNGVTHSAACGGLPAQPYVADEQKVTASLPLDHDNYWYGVLAMDIPVASLQRFLRDAGRKRILKGNISYTITISVC